MTRLFLCTFLCSLTAVAADAPGARPLTDDDRQTFGAPLAYIARSVIAAVPERYQPCELERDAADLIRPGTLIEGSGVTSDDGLEPQNWAVVLRCKVGVVVVRLWGRTLTFEETDLSGATVVARSADYLHVRKSGAERMERVLIRTASIPSLEPLKIAEPRTVEVRWIGLTPGDSVAVAARAGRQVLAKMLILPEVSRPGTGTDKKP